MPKAPTALSISAPSKAGCFAGGTNSVVNRGSIAGPVTLGGGSNSFTIGAGSSVSGPVIANGSDDLLILATGGTDAAPQELRLAGFTGFERTRQDSGTLALSGDFTTGTLTVAGGRFIGRTGSVLNAGSILVNPGATFGSAGTVNGLEREVLSGESLTVLSRPISRTLRIFPTNHDADAAFRDVLAQEGIEVFLGK